MPRGDCLAKHPTKVARLWPAAIQWCIFWALLRARVSQSAPRKLASNSELPRHNTQPCRAQQDRLAGTSYT